MNKTAFTAKVTVVVKSHDRDEIAKFLDILKGCGEACQIVFTRWKVERTTALSPWEPDDLRDVENLSAI